MQRQHPVLVICTHGIDTETRVRLGICGVDIRMNLKEQRAAGL
jgi:hypothetical protein